MMFQVHPTSLARRRSRCRPVAERVRVLPRQLQLNCNLCGTSRTLILACQDRYGFPIRTGMCPNCGLVFLVDRLTAEAYSAFYGNGVYRLLSNAFNDGQAKVTDIHREQQNYARELIASLRGYVLGADNAQLLDVGGSAGMVAREVAKHLGLRPFVLDPSEAEIAAARSIGVNGAVGSIETFETSDKFAVILLCRSIEHLFDLSASLKKIHTLLQPDGIFYCDVIDYVESCRRIGAPQTVSKIDHCFWLCQESAPAIFRHLGFEIVSINISSQPQVLGYVLRRCQPAPLEPMTNEWVTNTVRKLREIDSEWRASAGVPYDAKDWMFRAMYRLKARVFPNLALRRHSKTNS
jgi:SAM-dependent methyltransferase